jgi:hypothetical protein
MLTLSQTAAVLVGANTEAAKLAASVTVGNIINTRVTNIITPKLPLMVRGYASTPLGKAALANMVSAAIVHFMPKNEKAMLAANAMVTAAMLEFTATFNIESMIDEVLNGLDLSSLTGAAQ